MQFSCKNGQSYLRVALSLSANAVRSTNALDGIDYCSSNNSTVCAVQAVSVPALFVAMSASVFIRDNELAYESAKSVDKDFIAIEGATHSAFMPCTECEKPREAYSNSARNFFDYVARWINERF